jgi:hypothetical protein
VHRWAAVLSAIPVMALVQKSDCAASSQTSTPGSDLFNGPAVRHISIEIPSDQFRHLRDEPRRFVHASMSSDRMTYNDVGIHLKGAIGSFRPVDDKPSLTIDVAVFKEAQRFHGLRRIHLNNSVEDPSFLNEQLGSELMQAAGIPSPRVTHATVELNGRSLGLYVLIEGFTEDFLASHFKTVSGDLYEPEPGQDIDGQLKRSGIKAPHRNRDALRELAESTMEADSARRWERLQKVLNIDPFVTFMAMEVMLGHRDGYCLARNNFRVYFDSDTHKLVFFPHGMDQLFGKPDFPWQPFMAGLVAAAVMDTPEGKQRYVERFSTLLTNVFQIDSLTNRVSRLISELRPFLGHHEFFGLETEAAALEKRIVERRLSLIDQVNQPPLKPMEFNDGFARLAGWEKVDQPAQGKMEETSDSSGTPALYISARSDTCASWRTKAALEHGEYIFVGKTRIAGVKALPYGKRQGAGLRVTGSLRQGVDIIGDCSWRLLEAPFQVEAASAVVEFVCELRASAGEVWFDLDSLRVLRKGGRSDNAH